LANVPEIFTSIKHLKTIPTAKLLQSITALRWLAW